jgi:hypothetical protein
MQHHQGVEGRAPAGANWQSDLFSSTDTATLTLVIASGTDGSVHAHVALLSAKLPGMEAAYLRVGKTTSTIPHASHARIPMRSYA